MNSEFKAGDQLFGYVVKRVEELPKINNILIELEHTKSGAKHIHLQNDDTNNVFGVALKTTPEDSTGVAHILEHTALCGSEKYPVRDPFFGMIKRSINTFMNAFTASDWTMYPFSSQNESDYYNLLGVYLDAVYFPKLTELDFMQEGHRLEFTEGSNSDTALEIKGIVYNEMKGAMSSSSSIGYQKNLELMFPTTTYKFNSGGDPLNIPDLTYDNFKRFHKRFYHPSNSYFYTYGSMDLKKHLSYISENVLNKFDSIDPKTDVPLEQRYAKPKKVDCYYPLSENENDGLKNNVTISWLLKDVIDPYESLVFNVINHIFVGHAGATLRKNLLESKLGKSLSDAYGFSQDYRETFFSIGLEGVKACDMVKVEELILSSIDEVVKNEIDEADISAALHQIEFRLKEITGDCYPHGLSVLFNFVTPWLHGGDSVKFMNIDKYLTELKQNLKDKNYLKDKIIENFIDNNHRVTLNLIPDFAMKERNEKELEDKLSNLKSKMNDEQKNSLVKNAKKLQEYQDKENDFSCLPKIEVKDLNPLVKTIKALPELDEIDGAKLYFYDQPTNGISYIKYSFSLSDLKEEEILLLPIISSIFTKVGTQEKSYEQMAKDLSLYTGGLSSSVGVDRCSNELDKAKFSFDISSKCLDSNIEKMISLVSDFINGWSFENIQKIESIIKDNANELISSVAESGHAYAAKSAMKNYSLYHKLTELTSGITYVKKINLIANKSFDEIKRFVKSLEEITSKILTKNNLNIAIVSKEENFDTFKGLIAPSINSLELKNVSEINLEYEKNKTFADICTTTTNVSYVVKTFNTPTLVDADCPIICVLAKLISGEYLHPELREKGGAYGGFSTAKAVAGGLFMGSYRDPNIKRTLETYNKTLEWLDEYNLSQNDVDLAILQLISDIDSPLSPAGEAFYHFNNELRGLSTSDWQKFRDGLLSCTAEDIKLIAKKYLTKDHSISIVTSSDMLAKDNPGSEYKVYSLI